MVDFGMVDLGMVDLMKVSTSGCYKVSTSGCQNGWFRENSLFFFSVWVFNTCTLLFIDGRPAYFSKGSTGPIQSTVAVGSTLCVVKSATTFPFTPTFRRVTEGWTYFVGRRVYFTLDVLWVTKCPIADAYIV